jgi:hypothetical protein
MEIPKASVHILPFAHAFAFKDFLDNKFISYHYCLGCEAYVADF